MLVFSRRKGQKVVINGNIFIEVAQIRPDEVKLSFVAPKDVTIDRMEVHLDKKRQKEHDDAANTRSDRS